MRDVKVGEEKKEDAPFNLDWILAELGSFGKYQVLLLSLLGFRDGFLMMCNFNYMFTAAEAKYRCFIPECETTGDMFNASWLDYAIPNTTSSYYRYSSIANSSYLWNDTVGANNSCSSDMFDRERLVPCERIIYESYNSVVAEFDLGRDPWKRTLIGTVHNLGLVVSFILSGLISDRYGRKMIIVGTPLVVGTAGLLKSFSVNYWMLLVLEFLETAFGYGNASLVLTLEIVSQHRRVVFSCLSDITGNCVGAFFGLLAWKFPYWRHLMRAIYSPLLIVVCYIFLVDEGVRWLLAHNKRDEAIRILNKVAKVNNVELSNTARNMMEKIREERNKAELANKKTEPESHLCSVLRSKTIWYRLIITAACFFCGLFVFTGALINSSNISGNKYLNYSLAILVAVPTRVISAITLTRFGRKTPICVGYGLCAVFFVTSAIIPKSYVWWLPTLLYMLGKMCISFSLFATTVFAMEVFPTTSRNSLTNLANTLGRIGSVLAPQAPLLEHYMPGLASVAFGVASLSPAILCLLLPDSSRVRLPDDVRDAEKLDHQEPSKDSSQV